MTDTYRALRRAFLLALVGGSATAAVAQQAAPTISVTNWVAPNVFGSNASFDAAADNQYSALRSGASSAGTPGTPGYYQALTSAPIAYGNVIATNFNSWKGDANPTSTYGPGFGNELGNRVYFGIAINGNGSRFSISQLSITFSSNDSLNYFGGSINTYQYGPYDYVNGTYGGYVGVRVGNDGQLGTADDELITSGPNTQLVDYLFGRGSGTADAVYCGAVPDTSGPCGAANQSYINDEIAYLKSIGFSSLTGSYTLTSANGSPAATASGTVRFADATGPVPEPATWATLVLGFGMAGAALRRRRTAAAVA